jgi:hypothetical protein
MESKSLIRMAAEAFLRNNLDKAAEFFELDVARREKTLHREGVTLLAEPRRAFRPNHRC